MNLAGNAGKSDLSPAPALIVLNDNQPLSFIMPSKKSAKKKTANATKKAVKKKATKKAAKKIVKTETKKAVHKKVAKKATAKKKTPKRSAPSKEAIAKAAYLIYRHRIDLGLPGDQASDWKEAERTLSQS